MSDYPKTSRAALKLAEVIATDTKTVREAETKGLNQEAIRAAAARIDEELVQNDGVPPAAPSGVAVEVGGRSLIVSWNAPAVGDYVAQTEIRSYRYSNGALVRTQFVGGRSVTVPDLPPYQLNGTTRESFDLQIKHIDRWGLLGATTSSGPHQPLLFVADEMSVAKLTAGTFSAGDITLAGTGRLRAGSNVTIDSSGVMAGLVTLDAEGITLPRWTGNVNAPAQNRNMKISSGDELSAISFFLDTTYERRGINMRADGASLLSAGVIALEATPTGGFGERETEDGWIYVRARKSGQPDGHVYLGPRLVVTGRIKAEGLEPNYYCFPKSVNSGAEVAWTHNLGNDQYLAHMQHRQTSEASWTGLHNDVTGIYIKGLHPNEIRLKNNTNVTLVVRGFLINMRGLS